jgi:3-hydroxyisobutyrate dehydrogenase-like beta-hydroxyacid dehydrogenase
MKRAYSTAIGKKVGFLGLGNMGLPMAVNLQKNGFDVTGFEIGEKQKENAKQAGTKVASSIAEAVKNADWVVTALPKTEHV